MTKTFNAPNKKTTKYQLNEPFISIFQRFFFSFVSIFKKAANPYALETAKLIMFHTVNAGRPPDHPSSPPLSINSHCWPYATVATSIDQKQN